MRALYKSKQWLFSGLLALALVAAGCAPAAPEESETTSPPEPTEAIAATETPTEEAAPTDTPGSATATEVEFSETLELPIAGFSFQSISGSWVDLFDGEGGEALVWPSRNEDRAYTALRALPASDGRSSQQVIDDFVQELASYDDFAFTLELDEPFEATVGGHDALAVDIISGTLAGNPVDGQIIVIDLGNGLRVRGFGVAVLSEDEALWEELAEPHYSATIGTLQALGD